ncbi:serine/threonine protein kinase [Bremerella cremea]|uniref:non-specific serine/threonine protein kinase n=1 Tax=Bremerella cremea TaxID=1031537 RepID=A0A368KN59_9BACT|nr:serine/threonine-protein kinase [Bremerella cremea]RCS44624.1 serine/threonine protein kinase [Bremerella cremea]
MNSQENACCSHEKLYALVSGKLVAQEEQVIETHLDACTACQRKLEQAAADADSWSEASAFLQDDPWRSSFVGDPPDATSPNALPIQQTLELLGPTDDPGMLGRIGVYEISGVIGSGGMGVVLKGVDRSLDRTVAIKVLSPHLASTAAARKRFEREAKAAAAVIHPNVIAIHAVSVDSPLPYLVMPYVRGATLQKRIDNEGSLPLVDVLRIGRQIAEGLAAAHDQGLVHRDIKPSNILLEDGIERVTITDFGLARAVDDASITRTNIIAGTPQFMSPEQARGEYVDHRSDLFSLGSVLYTVCAGRPPFRAETTFGVLRKITDQPPRPLREINPEVPPWLACLIDRLLHKTSSGRYGSAHHVAELLQQCLAHATTPNAPLPRELRSTWRLSRRAIGGLVATVMLGLVTIGLASQGRYGEKPAQHSPGEITEATAPSTPQRNTPNHSNIEAVAPQPVWAPRFSIPQKSQQISPLDGELVPEEILSWEPPPQFSPGMLLGEAEQLHQQTQQPFAPAAPTWETVSPVPVWSENSGSAAPTVKSPGYNP